MNSSYSFFLHVLKFEKVHQEDQETLFVPEFDVQLTSRQSSGAFSVINVNTFAG